jgi:Tol biopolymer transport system component
MSPEQVRGEPTDHRTDIFALGCVLYEMLTGKRAFKRDTPIQSMSAVLSEEPPDLSNTENKVPARMERLLRRCLEKSPENRFESAKDLAFALEDGTHEVGPRGVARTGTLRRVELALLGCALLLVIVWLAIRARPVADSAPATWVEITPPNQRFDSYPTPAVSPDGRQIAFWAPAPDDTNQSGLWVRSLDSPVVRLLPGTTTDWNGVAASWSPDGRSLAFFAESKLKRIELSGGTPLTLAGAVNPRGCTWGSRDTIIFVPAAAKAAYRISASGGDAIPLKLAAPLDGYVAWPHFLPDGEHFLISTDTNGEFIVSADGAAIRRLGKTALQSRVEFAGGYLFFGREGSLFAQRFDPQALAVSGEALRVAEGLGFSVGDTHDYAFSVSAAGTLAYWSGPFLPVTQLTWFSREGQRLGAVGQPGECIGFDVSSNEQEAVLELHTQLNEIGLWLMEVASGVQSKFSLDGGPGRWTAACPVWSHFDSRIYFSTFPGLAVQSLNAHAEERLFDQPCWLEDISPDGNYALVSQATSDAGQHTCLLSLKKPKATRPYLISGHETSAGHFSPDGHWVAYFGDESGRWEVYVQSFPEPGRPVQISRNGGQSPEWRQDGKELYFLSPDGKLMAAAVDGSQPLFRVTDLKPLFPVNVGGGSPRRQFHPSQDGQRFLVNTQVESATAPRLKMVLNWKSLLPKK